MKFFRKKTAGDASDQVSEKDVASMPKLSKRKRVEQQEYKPRPLNDRLSYWLFVGSILLGFAASGAYIALGVLKSIDKGKYCLVLHEDFSSGTIDSSVWQHEVETGGFGNHEFQWTTASNNNSFVKDGMLHIVPTLTSDQFGDDAIVNGYTLNLTASGDCTASNKSDASCAVVSNRTTGAILPPVQSARLTTNISHAIRYGKVEVRARMPTGDWLWPAIWMMPRESKYGAWPMSGEIDIMESKGNAVTKRKDDFANMMKSTLHWGPVADDPSIDGYAKVLAARKLYRNFYNQDFHTFGLEWNEKEIFTWEASPALRLLNHQFTKKSMFDVGQFPVTTGNGTKVTNPWGANRIAPFDQEFYLILNVAVGGTNGYFEDGKHDNKPWLNTALNPRGDFWAAKDKWLPTWPTDPAKRGMVVDYVKIWQKC